MPTKPSAEEVLREVITTGFEKLYHKIEALLDNALGFSEVQQGPAKLPENGEEWAPPPAGLVKDTPEPPVKVEKVPAGGSKTPEQLQAEGYSIVQSPSTGRYGIRDPKGKWAKMSDGTLAVFLNEPDALAGMVSFAEAQAMDQQSLPDEPPIIGGLTYQIIKQETSGSDSNQPDTYIVQILVGGQVDHTLSASDGTHLVFMDEGHADTAGRHYIAHVAQGGSAM